MQETNFVYYRRRAAEEKSAAERASCIQAARAHRQIADHYADLASRFADPPTAQQPPKVASD